MIAGPRCWYCGAEVPDGGTWCAGITCFEKYQEREAAKAEKEASNDK